ncbi:MAG: GNAT family N-acetyltransferase [Elusimicrobia bacterium]|nr:GNAT family N-acetyltransferase [Elusimicrobiota bacterium]
MSASPKSRRLHLRPLAEADAGALRAAVDASREVLRRRLRWGGEAATVEGSRGFIAAAARDRRLGGREVYGVFEGRTGALAGVAALQGLLSAPGLAELSLWIRADRQGRGYGVEAGRLLAARAFRRAELQKVYARLDPGNRAARKVIQRCGFRYEGCLRHEKRLNGRWIDQECWGLLRSEWRSR